MTKKKESLLTVSDPSTLCSVERTPTPWDSSSTSKRERSTKTLPSGKVSYRPGTCRGRQRRQRPDREGQRLLVQHKFLLS